MSHLDQGKDRVPVVVKLGILLALITLVYVATRIAPHF